MLSDHVLRTYMSGSILRLPEDLRGLRTFGVAAMFADVRKIQSLKNFPVSVQGLIGRIMVTMSHELIA